MCLEGLWSEDSQPAGKQAFMKAGAELTACRVYSSQYLAAANAD
jgi:hypothetical protein